MHREQQGKDAVGKQPCRIGALLRADAGIGRHKGGIEGTLGKNRAEMIGQPQRHEEGVRDRPGAEHGRQHDVARKAGQARQQRQAADGEDASEHRPAIPLKCVVVRKSGRPNNTNSW